MEAQAKSSGRKPTFQRQYQIQHMWQRHHEIVRLHMLGHSNKAIAIILGITPQTVSITLNSQIVQNKIQMMSQQRDEAVTDIGAAIKNLAPDAISVVATMLGKEVGGIVPPAVQLKAAMDILDRNGFKPPEKHQHIHQHLTSEEVEAIKRRALEYGKANGTVIDCEPDED